MLNKGFNMTGMVFSCVGFVALVGAALLYISRENTDYANFTKGVDLLTKRLDAIESNAQITRTMQTASRSALITRIESLEQKISEYESKLNTASDLAHRANVSIARSNTPLSPSGNITVDVRGAVPVSVIERKKTTNMKKVINATTKRKN